MKNWNNKNLWTTEETRWLMVGVVLFNEEGSRAKWKKIVEKFQVQLRKKTNTQCKDKYTNIVSSGTHQQQKADAEKFIKEKANACWL